MKLCIVGVPASVQLRNLRHIEELTHEMQLMEIGEADAVEPTPARIVRLINGVMDAYGDARDATRRQAEEAIAAGCDLVDLEVELPAEAAENIAHLVALLEEADELCRKGGMLTLAADDEVAALRRWMKVEIAAQLAGADPTPYLTGR